VSESINLIKKIAKNTKGIKIKLKKDFKKV
jgi:hypothetical protein